MNLLTRIWQSSLGKKYLMAITGCALVLFACGHMVGNLQIFLPPEAINRYAHFLKSIPELLWIVRLSLLTLVVLHIISAIRLSWENKTARPLDYAGAATPYAASYASRTMLVSGLIIGSFVIYHLLHYTVLVEAVNFTGIDFATLKDPKTNGPDVYAMVVYGFSKWFVSLFYIIAVGLLCLHLSHGIAAMFQSMGWKSPVYGPVIDKAAKIVAIALFIGYASIPVAVMCGLGKDHLAQTKMVVQPVAGKEVAQ